MEIIRKKDSSVRCSVNREAMKSEGNTIYDCTKRRQFERRFVF